MPRFNWNRPLDKTLENGSAIAKFATKIFLSSSFLLHSTLCDEKISADGAMKNKMWVGITDLQIRHFKLPVIF